MHTLYPIRFWALASCFAFLVGCGFLAPIFGPVYQTTDSHVDQAKDEGYIRFENVSSQHQIILDGSPIGSGAAYTDGGVLAVSPGTHVVEIMENNTLTLKEKVFIGTGSTRTIEVR